MVYWAMKYHQRFLSWSPKSLRNISNILCIWSKDHNRWYISHIWEMPKDKNVQSKTKIKKRGRRMILLLWLIAYLLPKAKSIKGAFRYLRTLFFLLKIAGLIKKYMKLSMPIPRRKGWRKKLLLPRKLLKLR